jgi:hypothetical protein
VSRSAIALACRCDQCSGREGHLSWVEVLEPTACPTRERVIHQAVNRELK